MSEPDRYLTLKDCADYCRLSVRTLNRYLVSAKHPLPHFRVGGRVLIRASDFDRWVELVGRKDRPNRDGTVMERAARDVDRTYASGDDQFGVLSRERNRDPNR